MSWIFCFAALPTAWGGGSGPSPPVVHPSFLSSLSVPLYSKEDLTPGIECGMRIGSLVLERGAGSVCQEEDREGGNALGINLRQT